MPKTAQYSKSVKGSGSVKPAASYSYVDRNLAAMSPEKAQEALKPTESEPVRMHTRMAGCA